MSYDLAGAIVVGSIVLLIMIFVSLYDSYKYKLEKMPFIQKVVHLYNYIDSLVSNIIYIIGTTIKWILILIPVVIFMMWLLPWLQSYFMANKEGFIIIVFILCMAATNNRLKDIENSIKNKD